MNKYAKHALGGSALFFIEWGILAGISIARDYGAFTSWYRNVFRHPRLIAIGCAVVAVIVLMLLYKPEKPLDVGFFIVPVLLFNLIVNSIISHVYFGRGGDDTDLGFWPHRMKFIFNYMVVGVILMSAVMLFASKAKDRRKMIISGVICTICMWFMFDVVGWLNDFLYSIFEIDIIDVFYINEWYDPLIVIDIILALLTFIVLKAFRFISSYKQLVFFGASAFIANMLYLEALCSIYSWDGGESGLGVYFVGMGIYGSLMLLCGLFAIDLLRLKISSSKLLS